MDDRELGQRIAYWRRRRGWTQRLFADRLGRSTSWVIKIESGARGAGRLATLDLICEALRIDLAALIGEEPSDGGWAIEVADSIGQKKLAMLRREQRATLRPLTQATIADLVRRSKNAPPDRLARLAERAGVQV